MTSRLSRGTKARRRWRTGKVDAGDPADLAAAGVVGVGEGHGGLRGQEARGSYLRNKLIYLALTILDAT